MVESNRTLYIPILLVRGSGGRGGGLGGVVVVSWPSFWFWFLFLFLGLLSAGWGLTLLQSF